MFYEQLFEALHRGDIRYLVVGGVAVNLYDVPRMTHDVDLIVSFDTETILKVVELLSAMGFEPRLPVDPRLLADAATVEKWKTGRNLKAFSFFHPKERYQVVDILLDHPLNFDAAFERRTIKMMGECPIFVAALDDLISMKIHSGRQIDHEDIERLRTARFLEGEQQGSEGADALP